jgi:thiopeptide-type bacteriocin biosynthesis protein
MTSSCASEAGLALPDGIDPARLREVLGPHYQPFVAAGMAALAHGEHNRRWLQFGLAPLAGHLSAVHAGLLQLACRLLRDGEATNFFFMHKPPGVRVRFETTPEHRDALAEVVEAEFAAWAVHLRQASLGRYEPEAELFGGPTSMRYVHSLFTVDSLAWLAYSCLPDRCPAWVFSLAMVREMLNGLSIAGWEDLNVWERIKRQANRGIPAGFDQPKVAAVTAAMRALWADPEPLHQALGPHAAKLAGSRGPEIREAARQWDAGCFAIGDSVIGPREAAAFATIFHWNRGLLPAAVQALITGALADRSARP